VLFTESEEFGAQKGLNFIKGRGILDFLLSKALKSLIWVGIL